MTNMAKYMKQRRLERRTRCLELLGKECVKCKSTYDLEIDHVDRSQKSFLISGKNLDRTWAAILAELDKCQLLCRVCHLAKTASEVAAKHGTISRYYHRKAPCRCEPCKLAHKVWKKAYRDSRRNQGLTAH